MFYKFLISLLSLLLITGFSIAIEAVENRSVSDFIDNYRESMLKGGSFFRDLHKPLTCISVVNDVVIQGKYWDNDDWFNEEVIVYQYDEMGIVKGMTISDWCDDNEEWEEPWMSAVIERLPNGLVSSVILREFDYYDDDWFDFFKMTQEYNDNDQVVNVQAYFYDYDSWDLVFTLSFFYDEADILEEMNFVWTDEYDPDYQEISRLIMTYDQFGRLIEVVEEDLEDENDDLWIPYSKSVIEYHHSDNSTYNELQDFFNNFSFNMIAGLDWFIVGESFSPFGKIEVETFFEWDYYEEEWMIFDRDVFFYNEDNFVERIELQEYSETDDSWVAFDRTLLYYDDHGRVIELLEQSKGWDEELWFDIERFLVSYIELTSVEEYILSPSNYYATNYPNPFNPETTIVFHIPANQYVKMNIYDIKGRLIKNLVNDNFQAGSHSIIWDGKNNHEELLSSGLYLYRIETEGNLINGKMMLLK